jgi:type I restriction-modification system DNA methylase subunit
MSDPVSDLAYADTLWKSADALRGHVDAAERVFWVPPESRWPNLQNQATRPNIADTFLRDAHPDLKADFILANQPFNVSDWSGQLLSGDKRFAFGDPPVGNANYAWIQHFIHRLAYPNGRRDCVNFEHRSPNAPGIPEARRSGSVSQDSCEHRESNFQEAM